MTSSDDDSRDEIGYKKPPKKHQFEKGKSGNPSGARRRRPTVKGLQPPDRSRRSIKKLAQKKVTLVEGGRRRRVTTQDAMYQLLVRYALQGDKRSLLAVIKLISQVENEERDEYRALFRAAVEFKENTARAGKDSSSVPPHYPDHRDIEIDRINGRVEFTGPMDAEQARLFADMAAHRDELINEYEEDLKLSKETPFQSDEAELSGLLETIRRWNSLLPKRLQREPQSVEAAALEQCSGERLMLYFQRLADSNPSRSRNRRARPRTPAQPHDQSRKSENKPEPSS